MRPGYAHLCAGWADGSGRFGCSLNRMNKYNTEKSLIHQNSMVADSCEKSSQKIKLNYTFWGHWRHSCVRSLMCAWRRPGKEGLHVWDKRESQEEGVSFQK